MSALINIPLADVPWLLVALIAGGLAAATWTVLHEAKAEHQGGLHSSRKVR
jgi:hypothetical protein